MKVDFIIVGQGIAGTCFAFQLLKSNKTFIIIDKYEKKHTSSRLALGIYNPLILKWFTKPWDVDNQLCYFYNFYNELNSFLNQSFFEDIGIYKFLPTPYDQNMWLTKNTSPMRSKYMSSKLLSIDNSGLINNKFYGLVKYAGRVNIQLVLEAFRSYCITNNLIIEETFDYNNLIINSNSVKLNNIIADKIIFCQGYSGIDNPYFNNLNFNPTKGETLTISCKGLNLKKIIHSGLLFVPIGNDDYTIGATYNWKKIDTSPTLKVKNKITSVIDSVLKKAYVIKNHRAGIRPSTFDRRALVGAHKKYPHLYILNGLGSRGVLLAPYLSSCLIKNIYKNSKLDDAININRIDDIIKKPQ